MQSINENSLRWKARIGSLKSISIVVIIMAGFGLIYAIGELLAAVQNPTEPRVVTIEQIVTGSIRSGQYVTLEGFAMYDTGYEETENGAVIASYFLLLDDLTGHLVVVQASDINIDQREMDWITLAGMTRKTSYDLRGLIESDTAFFKEQGFSTTPDIYLSEGDKPAGDAQSLILVLVLAGLVVGSIVPFFYPTTVFLPKPIEMFAMDSFSTTKKAGGLKATGRFIQLKKVEPSLELGKRKQKFTQAVANIIPMDQGDLIIYIHHVIRYNFITVSKTHWGLFLNNKNVSVVEPGIKLGWKDNPAVQFNYSTEEGKPETLLLAFDHASDLTSYVKFLREKGFKIGSGISSQAYP